MSKELVFKVVLQADTQKFTQNVQQSGESAQRLFDLIQRESDRIRQSMQMRQEVGDLVQQFHNATQALNGVSDASQLSADNLRSMGEYGQQAVNRLQTELEQARLELNRLSATNATPVDIQNAAQRVQQLETGIRQTTIAVNAYQNAAQAAMNTPPVPTQFQRDVASLVSGLEGVRQGIDANGNSATHTRQQLEQMSRDATTQLQNYENQLQQARLEVNRLFATNATPADIQRAQQRVQELEAGVRQVETALQGYQRQARISNDEAASGMDRARGAIGGLSNAWGKLAGLAAAVGVGIGVNELIQIADSFQNISTQIRLVTNSSEEFQGALEGVRLVATETTTSLDATAKLYANISRAGKDLGVTQQQALDITRAINQSIQISGASAASSEAAIIQLIQGLQSGVLRGEEFNSMMEQAPRLTTALADSLKVTKGELRAMANEGELTAQVVIKALKEQAAVIGEEYKKVPTTISGAFENLKTNFTMLVGEIDSTNAASQSLVKILLSIADNLDVLKVLFEDTSAAFGFLNEKFGQVDPSIIESLKNAFVSAYDAIKSLISAVVDIGVAIVDVVGSAFDLLTGLGGLVGNSSEKINGFSAVLSGVSVILGVLSDGCTGFAIGLKGLVGLLYDVAAAALYWLKMPTFGSWREQLDQQHADLIKKRDEYYAAANQQAMDFNSKSAKAMEEAVLNEEQANQKKIANNQAALAKILKDEADTDAQLKVNAERRVSLQDELAKARAAGNQVAVMALLEEEKKLDQFDADTAKNKIQRNKDKLESAKFLAEASIKANDGVLSDLAKEELLRQGVIAKISEQGQLEIALSQDTAKLNAERLAKIQELSEKEQQFNSGRVSNDQATSRAIVQNETDVAAERTRLNDVVNKARQVGDFDTYSKAQLALDNLGKVDAQANQQRIDQHRQTDATIHQIDAASFSDFQARTDEQIRLQKAAAQAKQMGDFESYSKAMLQIDRLGTAQVQSNHQITQSDLETLRQKEGITKEKISLAQQIIDANNGVITSEQKAAFEAQGLTIEFDKAGKAAIQQKTTFSSAAKALGVDISQALNLVSTEFTDAGKNVDVFVAGLHDMGATGQQAADATYQAWTKWAEQAKSPAEIDAAKAKLLEFEQQGVFSAKQVEMGMRYLDEVNGKLPANISEVEKAYKLLGITSREEANKMAASLMKAFDVTVQSGTASAENIKQALINMADKIYASGDAAKIAWYEAKLSANGLQSSVDSLGKASVKSMDDLSDSVDRVGRTASGSAAQGFRQLGRVAKQEAEEVAETWEQAMARIDKERKAQSAQTAQNLGNALTDNATMAQDFYNQLIAGGMEQGRAEALKREAMVKMGNQLRDVLNGGTAQTRIDALTGRNSSKDWMDNILKLQGKSGSVSASAPKTPSTPNIQPPVTQPIKMPNLDVEPKSLATYKFEFGGKQFELQGDSSQQNVIDEFFREMEQAKKRW